MIEPVPTGQDDPMSTMPEVGLRQPSPHEQVDETVAHPRVRVAHHASETVVVHVSGSLDLMNTPQLALVLKPRLESAIATLVVDLSEVDFLGSAALRLLMQAHHRALHRGMSMRLVDGKPGVQRALHAAAGVGATRFAIYPDVPSAVNTPPSAAPTWNLRNTGAGSCASLSRQLKS